MSLKKKYPTNKSLSKKIKHIENDLIELKFCDTEAGTEATPVDIDNSAGIVIPMLDGVVVGDGNAQNRTGNKINVTSMQMRVDISSVPTLDNTTVIRELVVWDRQPNAGLYPVIAKVDVLTGDPEQDSILDITVISDPTRAPYNYNANQRFKIVHDKTYVLNNQVPYAWNVPTAPGTSTVSRYAQFKRRISKYFKCKRMVKYSHANADPAPGGSTNITTNALYVMYISNQSAGAYPELRSAYRIYYKDA